MEAIKYDNQKTLSQNVLNLFKFVNWVCREMMDGRVPMNKEELKTDINKVDTTQSITFVTLAENGAIDDVTASEHTELFIEWAENTEYKVGALRKYTKPFDENNPEYEEPKLYRCLQAHTSQADWTPDATPSLWKLTSNPEDEFPEYSQPVSSEDAYSIGDKVSHNGKKWESIVDNNVWSPDVYGWKEVE